MKLTLKISFLLLLTTALLVFSAVAQEEAVEENTVQVEISATEETTTLPFLQETDETTTLPFPDENDESVVISPDQKAEIIARFPDMPDNWSTDALVKAVQNGLLNGTDGFILPNDKLTRAQLATILVRAFGATEATDVSEFTDLLAEKWYYSAMATAVKMGIFQGDGSGNIRPDDTITRQEVFTVISRAFNITGADTAILAEFPDGALIADWAKDATASLVAGKYISGTDGYINPTTPITRAEFAQLMKNLVDAYITEEGVYTRIPAGNIVVRATGVTFDGVEVSGNLYIGEGAGEAITLTNVTSNSRVIVRGGANAVFTGTFNDISVVGKGLNIDLSGAKVTTYSTVSESVIVAPTVSDQDNTTDDSEEDDTNDTFFIGEDKDGDGWVDGWY